MCALFCACHFRPVPCNSFFISKSIIYRDPFVVTVEDESFIRSTDHSMYKKALVLTEIDCFCIALESSFFQHQRQRVCVRKNTNKINQTAREIKSLSLSVYVCVYFAGPVCAAFHATQTVFVSVYCAASTPSAALLAFANASTMRSRALRPFTPRSLSFLRLSK